MHDNETDDHYVPPDPPKIQISDPITAAAIIGVIGAPLLLVLLAIFTISFPLLLGVPCALVFVVSFATLFVRAKDRPRQDDGWDDGAVL